MSIGDNLIPRPSDSDATTQGPSTGKSVVSVLATRPNVTSGEFDKKDVENKDVNLLFFGNFHKMKLQDYEWAIQELIKDQTYVYNTLTKEK